MKSPQPALKGRNSSVELLRVLMMLLIVTHHQVVHNELNIDVQPFSLSKLAGLFLSSGGRLGVAVFVLISGYHLIVSDFQWKHLAKLLAQNWIYSAAALLFCLFALGRTVGNAMIAAMLTPALHAVNWFVQQYALLYLLVPFLNLLVRAMTREKHRALILLLVVLWSVIPTFTGFAPGFSVLSWFVTLYLTAAYFRLYPGENRPLRHLVLALFWVLVLFALMAWRALAFERMEIDAAEIRTFNEYNMLPTFLLSVELLLLFVQVKPFHSKFVNLLARTTLGIYLLHDNDLARGLLWKELFSSVPYYTSGWRYVPFVLGSALLVFAACSLIDLIFWQMLFGRLVGKILGSRPADTAARQAGKAFGKLVDRLKNLV